VLVAGLFLIGAAVSVGKDGPGLENIQFSIDSSGAAAPLPTAAPPPALLAPDVRIRGRRVTMARRPLFLLGLDRRLLRRLHRSQVRFVCRIGKRRTTRTLPCGNRFRAPDIGPGRHVLVVRMIGPSGRKSGWVKIPYFVRKLAYRR
jgi:hypothetical protein